MLRSSLNLFRTMSWVLSSSTENLSETTSEWKKKTETFKKNLQENLLTYASSTFFKELRRKGLQIWKTQYIFFKKTLKNEYFNAIVN